MTERKNQAKHHGPVLVTEGWHEGSAGYYDDDQSAKIAVVYWGMPGKSDYSLIERRYLVNVTSETAVRLGWKAGTG